jgi:hypothetical protein
MSNHQELYKFKITEIHEYYAWVPANSPEEAADLLSEGDDPGIETATIRRFVAEEYHLGPACPNDRGMTLSMHAYLNAQKAAEQSHIQRKNPARYTFNVVPLEAFFKS